MGINNLDLIHFNDAKEKKGSRLDAHTVPGKGTIGLEVMQRIFNHPRLREIPFLVELPAAQADQCDNVIAHLQTW